MRVLLGWVVNFFGCVSSIAFFEGCVCVCGAQLGGVCVCVLSERGTVSVHWLWTVLLGVTAVAFQLLMLLDQEGSLSFSLLVSPALALFLSSGTEDPSIGGIPVCSASVWDRNLFIPHPYMCVCVHLHSCHRPAISVYS